MKTLPKRTKYFFDQFVSAANKQILHPNDWKRFYHFIQASHEGRTILLSKDLEEIFLYNGFDEETAQSLSYVYFHGRKMLESRIMLYCYYKKRREDNDLKEK